MFHVELSFFRIFLLGALCFLSLFGCKKREEQPELRSPVFLDLVTREAEYSKEIETTQKEIAQLTKDIRSAQPNTKDLHSLRKKMSIAQRNLPLMKQKLRYHKILIERRRFQDRLAYNKAMDEEKEWPHPEELRAYESSKRLASAHKQWNSRVPKLKDRLKLLEKRTPAAAAASSHH